MVVITSQSGMVYSTSLLYITPETNRSSIKITLSSYTILIYLYIISIYVITFHRLFSLIWNDLPTMNRYNENKHTLSSHHERNKQQQYNHPLSRHNTHLIWRIIKNIQQNSKKYQKIIIFLRFLTVFNHFYTIFSHFLTFFITFLLFF